MHSNCLRLALGAKEGASWHGLEVAADFDAALTVDDDATAESVADFVVGVMAESASLSINDIFKLFLEDSVRDDAANIGRGTNQGLSG